MAINETIAFWLNWFGGIDIVWLILAIFAATQIFKQALDVFGKYDKKLIRPFPYVAGAFLASLFIDPSPRSAMIGVSCGMLSSLGFYAALAYLERAASPDWQKAIADRLSMR